MSRVETVALPRRPKNTFPVDSCAVFPKTPVIRRHHFKTELFMASNQSPKQNVAAVRKLKALIAALGVFAYIVAVAMTKQVIPGMT